MISLLVFFALGVPLGKLLVRFILDYQYFLSSEHLSNAANSNASFGYWTSRYAVRLLEYYIVPASVIWIIFRASYCYLIRRQEFLADRTTAYSEATAEGLATH